MENVESRNRDQEFAMCAMYGFLIDQDNNKPIDVKATLELASNKPYDEVSIFLKDLIIQSLKYENDIIDYCQGFLKNWKFSRLNYCVQAILILAIANNKYLKSADKPVIINVAVKLAKKYGADNDYKFVNAVLDNCLND